MVNTGGPSKGCITCIKRKIRCDQQRPVCGQCQKSNRKCGGYRNKMDTIFRDESQAVFAKGFEASLRQATITGKTRQPEDSDSTDTSIGSYGSWINSGTPVMISSPKLNEESGLINFFTNNFTCGFHSRGTNLFWIPSNFDDLLKEGCARLSAQSVGAMALARLQRSAYYHREAQKLYGLALISLTESLRQHHLETVKDTVMVTMLFLGFFEVLASYDDSSRQSWTTHLGGLGLLLNQQGENFLKGDFGAKMLKQSRSQAIINAVQTKTNVPDAFQHLAQPLPRSISPDLVASEDADLLLIRLATLQAQYQTSGLSSALVSELVVLDGDLRQWTENPPPLWRFSTQSCEGNSELWWEARHDVYSLPVIANIWNKIRAARIIIHDLVQEKLSQFSLQGAEIAATSQQQVSPETLSPKIQNLVLDVCATIPMFYRPSSATIGPDASASQPLLGTAYWFLWVLEVVGSMRQASPRLTEWARQVLKRIYQTTGIVKAQLVAQRLPGGQT